MIAILWLELSHLNEHRFNHTFNNCLNPVCTCSLDFESTVYFFLHCNCYNNARISLLLNDLNSVDRTLLNLSDLSLVNVLLYGGPPWLDHSSPFLNWGQDLPKIESLEGTQKFLLERRDKPEKGGGGGGGGLPSFLLLYSSISFTLYVGKVKFSLLLQDFKSLQY